MIHDIHKWEHLPFPKSLPQFQKLFPNNAACARYLEGPHYPAAHTWYAEAELINGVIVKVK